MVDIHSHKEAAHFKLKSFPYYDELSMIFGKDCATGQHAETQTDVEEQLQNEGGDYNGDDNASSKNVNNASDSNVDIQLVSNHPRGVKAKPTALVHLRNKEKLKAMEILLKHLQSQP